VRNEKIGVEFLLCLTAISWRSWELMLSKNKTKGLEMKSEERQTQGGDERRGVDERALISRVALRRRGWEDSSRRINLDDQRVELCEELEISCEELT
jgi:hypothetical protein